jgi:hypothetical protein
MNLNFDFMDGDVLTGTGKSKTDTSTIRDLAQIVYDMGAVREKFIEYGDQLAKMKSEAEALKVDSDISAAQATEMVGQTKKLLDEIDDERKSIVKDPDGFVRKVNAFVKVFKDRLKSIKITIDRKMDSYAYQLELKRREEEREAADELARKQKELDREAKKAGVAPVKLPQQAIPRKHESIRTESGISSVTTKIVWEIGDLAKVPRQYLMIDKKKVDQAVKAGIRNIPGIVVQEKASMSHRKV